MYTSRTHTHTHGAHTPVCPCVHTKHMQTNKQFHFELKCRWIEIELFHKPSLINQSHNKYFTHSLNRSLSFTLTRSLPLFSAHFDSFGCTKHLISDESFLCVCACVCWWAIVGAWLWSPINNCEHSFSINSSFISVSFRNYTPQTYARWFTCFELFTIVVEWSPCQLKTVKNLTIDLTLYKCAFDYLPCWQMICTSSQQAVWSNSTEIPFDFVKVNVVFPMISSRAFCVTTKP